MTHKMVTNANGTCSRMLRDDAIKFRGRYIVPTTDKTLWVSSWEEFKAAGGNTGFNEDQTEIELLLPEPYKFSIQFMKKETP